MIAALGRCHLCSHENTNALKTFGRRLSLEVQDCPLPRIDQLPSVNVPLHEGKQCQTETQHRSRQKALCFANSGFEVIIGIQLGCFQYRDIAHIESDPPLGLPWLGRERNGCWRWRVVGLSACSNDQRDETKDCNRESH